MVNYSAVFLIVIITIIFVFVLIEGYVVNPRSLLVKMTRKKAFPSKADITKLIRPSKSPHVDWTVIRPNTTVNTLVLGGLGNTLMAYSVGCEASRRHGLRPPTLIIEPEGEFDFHRITEAKFGFKPTSINEILPWANTCIMNSGFNVLTSMNNMAIWMGINHESFPVKRNVIQITHYETPAEVSDETFDFVRRSINGEIYSYIETNYGDLSDCMAVHLRMGQPTDWFTPPSPSSEDIMNHYNKYKPSRVLIFTDNKPLAEKVLESCPLPNILWVGESGPIELFMVGMCSSAVISHSTFSVMGCRLFGRKQVSISLCADEIHFESFVDKSWERILKNIDYRSHNKK